MKAGFDDNNFGSANAFQHLTANNKSGTLENCESQQKLSFNVA